MISSIPNSSRILVIGSNSFSGSHFVREALEGGHNVWGISRSKEPNKVFLPYLWDQTSQDKKNLSRERYCFTSLDLNNDMTEIISLIREICPTHIVNFAAQGMVAQSWLNPTHWYKTNVVSQVALHDELRKLSSLKKYVHVTTPEVYGSTDQGWIKESYNFSPSTPYAVSRAACDLHLISFYKAYDFPVVFTRAANVYGPGQQLYRIIPRTLLSTLTGKELQLHGGGLSKRSFIYIKDVVSATLKIAMEAEPGTTWHISTNEAISIRDLVQKICNLANIKFESIVQVGEERLGKDQNYLLDSTKLRQKFDWKDNFSLNDGLSATMEWAKSNIELLKDLPWSYKHKL